MRDSERETFSERECEAEMQKRRLARTGLDVSIVGFGAIKLPGVDEQTAGRALNRALDLGMNFIDTARGYGDSERKIGKTVGHRRGDFYLGTKTAERSAKGLASELETSLRELRTDCIDVYFLHSVSDRPTWNAVTAPNGALEGAKRAKEQGKIRHISVSIHRDLNVMKAAIESGEFDVIMLAYSPVDSEDVGPAILPLAKQHDLGVVIMKGLCGGALNSYRDDAGVEPRPEDPIVAGSLRYIVSNDAVTCVIPGMKAAWQVEQNAAVGRDFAPMSEQELRDFTQRLGRLHKEFRYGQVCLRCGYCQPCQEGILIPEIMRALDIYQRYPDELKQMAIDLYQSLALGPEACTECGSCAEKCPAGLDIPARLKEAAELFASLTGQAR